MNTLSAQTAFTLIELVVTIAVVAVTLTVGVPSFKETIERNRVVTASNNLLTALSLARSEAIRRPDYKQVTVCKANVTSSPPTCNTSTCATSGTNCWEKGWLVFADKDGDGVVDSDGDANLCETADDDCVIQVFQAMPTGLTLRAGTNYTCWIAYQSNGMSRGSGASCTGGLSNDTFRLCRGTITTKSKSIVVSPTGRPMIQDGAASCP